MKRKVDYERVIYFHFLTKSTCENATENVVCFSGLLHTFATSLINISVEANSVDPDQTTTYRNSLTWVYNV